MVGKRVRVKTVSIACVAALVAAPFAASGTLSARSFSGNICSLLSAAQVAVIVGDSGGGSKDKCVASPTKTTPAGTTYYATAGTGTSVTKGGFLGLQLVKYAKPTLENLVKNEYKTMSPVSGIGDWAYAKIGPSPVAGGATADTGEFVFGAHGYGALFTVRAALGKKINQAALEALSKKIAATL